MVHIMGTTDGLCYAKGAVVVSLTVSLCGVDRHQQGGAEGIHRHHSFPVHHHGADTLPSMGCPSAALWLLL